MFTLGIPKTQYRRATQVLGHERSEPVEYNAERQDDGFYIFKFPFADEYDFRDIVKLLKQNGITTIGADDQLTERQIMKLVNLVPLEEMDVNDLPTPTDAQKNKTCNTQPIDCESINQQVSDLFITD